MKHQILFLSALILGLSSCGGDTENVRGTGIDTTSLADTGTVYQRARQILYNMPSPIEFTSLVKSAGGEFNADLLHDPDRRHALGAQLHARAGAQYDWTHAAQEIVATYARVLK